MRRTSKGVKIGPGVVKNLTGSWKGTLYSPREISGMPMDISMELAPDKSRLWKKGVGRFHMRGMEHAFTIAVELMGENHMRMDGIPAVKEGGVHLDFVTKLIAPDEIIGKVIIDRIGPSSFIAVAEVRLKKQSATS
jgi:hypothetical protein